MHIGNFGLIKVLVVSISFALAICFVGCGDDSSSGATNGDDSKAELNSEAEADTADVSGDIDDADVSSSSEDDEDEEVSSDSDDEEEDDDAEEAESSSSSKKSSKSSSSSKKKGKSSSSKAKSSGDDESEDPDDPEDPEDSGEEPAKPESSSSEKEEYPDLSVLSNPNLEQGCDIDKNDDIWVIPSQFMEAEKTVYIWKGDMYSVSSVVELPLGALMFCEMALGKVDSTLSSDEAGKDLDIQKTCDENGVLRTWSSSPFQKGDREAVFVNATILCREDLLD